MVNAVAFAVGAATAILLARVMGATERGELVVGSIGPILLGVLCTLGIEESIVYLNARTTTDPERRAVAWSGLVVAVVAGAVGSLVAIAVQLWYVGHRAGVSNRTALLVYATLPVLVAIIQALLGNLRGQGRYTSWNLVRLTTPVVYLGLVVLLITSDRLDVASALMVHWVANLLLAICLVAWLCTSGRPNPSWTMSKRLVKLGLGNHVITIQRLGNERLDQFVMARAISPRDLGSYAVAATYAACGLQIALAVGFQLYSHVSRVGSISHSQFVALCRRSFLLMTAIGVVGAGAAWLVIPTLIGREFDAGIVPAAILLAGGPPLTVGTLYASAWKSSGEPLRAARAEAVGLVVTVVLLFFLIRAWGIVGAAVTSVIAYSVVAALLVLGPPPTAIGVEPPGASDDRGVADGSALL
ncbi:MAG TPA: oligosaccharide flippase family protein [Mycobacterium sp.]|nr:oligosaccharide flippase family protein [Mycobacterium sp.]